MLFYHDHFKGYVLLYCSPNHGFKTQLELFEEMGNRIDHQHEKFKKYKLNNLAMKMQTGTCNQHFPVMVCNQIIGVFSDNNCHSCDKQYVYFYDCPWSFYIFPGEFRMNQKVKDNCKP